MVSILFISLSAFYLESMLVADIRCIPFSTQLFKLKTKMGIYIFTIIGNPSHVSLMIRIVEKLGLSEKILYLSFLEIYIAKSTKPRTGNRIHIGYTYTVTPSQNPITKTFSIMNQIKKSFFFFHKWQDLLNVVW